jgi:hypothetical protein
VARHHLDWYCIGVGRATDNNFVISVLLFIAQVKLWLHNMVLVSSEKKKQENLLHEILLVVKKSVRTMGCNVD